MGIVLNATHANIAAVGIELINSLDMKIKHTAANKNTLAKTKKNKCIIKNGIGPCDCCGLDKWPQRYIGYGFMFCMDCIEKDPSTL